jgi:hypothetical protein
VPNQNNTPAESTSPTELETRPPWHREVSQLLTRAAILCVQHGIDIDAYMSGAWAAYVEARPGMRSQLEELQLRDQLEELRKLGRIGQA